MREGGGDEGGCCRVCGLQDLSPPHGEVEKQQKSFFCLSVSSTTCRVLLTLVGRDASVVETATHESGAHGGWRRQGGVQAIRRDFWLARKGTCQSRARLMEPMMPVRTGTAGSADAFSRLDPVGMMQSMGNLGMLKGRLEVGYFAGQPCDQQRTCIGVRCLMQSKLAKQVLPVWDSTFGVAKCALRDATPVSPRRHPVQAQCGEVESPFKIQNCQEGTLTKRGKQRAGSAKLVPGKVCVDAKMKRRPLPCHRDESWERGPLGSRAVAGMEQGASKQVGPREYYARESMTPGPKIRGSAMFWKTNNAPRWAGV